MKLKDILRNEEKGAGELLKSAVGWLAKHPDSLEECRADEVLQILRRTRPAMVGFTVLADRLERDLKAHPELPPDKIVRAIQSEVQSAAIRLAERFAGVLRERGPSRVVTLSWSSSVLDCLRAADGLVSAVHVLESNPGAEGLRTYAAVSEFAGGAVLHFDEDMDEAVAAADIGVIGADTVFADGAVLNKVLSAKLARKLREAGKPLYVLATTWKRSTAKAEGHATSAKDALPFEIVPAELITAVVTE